jgi:hypothetical protein
MPGDHNTYIREHVEVTAAALRARLDAALLRTVDAPAPSIIRLVNAGDACPAPQ